MLYAFSIDQTMYSEWASERANEGLSKRMNERYKEWVDKLIANDGDQCAGDYLKLYIAK